MVPVRASTPGGPTVAVDPVAGTAVASGRRLGCQVRLTAVGDPGAVRWALDAGWALLEDREARWSRFRPGSEVSALNARPGAPVAVSTPTRDLVRSAVTAWHVTGGLVDALVLGDLVALGYDRSFELLAGDDGRRDGDPGTRLARGAARHRPTVAEVVVDEASGTVALPDGTGFDPGGIGKGRIADEVAATLVAAGAEGACVDLGGDVAVRGRPPEGDAWHVAVAHPTTPPTGTGRRHEPPIAVVALAEGAVATSATTRRRWHHGPEVVHHLIDPATGRPAATDAVAATAIAATAEDAEVLAKAAVLAGVADGVARIGEAGATGLVVTDEGWVVRVVGLDRYEVGGAITPLDDGGR